MVRSDKRRTSGGQPEGLLYETAQPKLPVATRAQPSASGERWSLRPASEIDSRPADRVTVKMMAIAFPFRMAPLSSLVDATVSPSSARGTALAATTVGSYRRWMRGVSSQTDGAY